MAIKAIFHVNVNCTDLDRSKAFYELLGFRSVIDLPPGGGADMLHGLGLPPGSRARGAIMMLDPDQPRSTRLDLLEWLEPRTWGRPYEDLAHVGAARIALWTTGLDEEVERLRAAGVDFLSEPVAMDGFDTRFVCFRDPDGTVLELIEFGQRPRSER